MDAATPTSNDDPRSGLASWLRAGRAHKKLTLEEVARITKIQARILEKLETGQLDGLPAEVFVRGFVRSFARCVGLDETEAVARFSDCAKAGPAAAKALVQTMVPAEPEPGAETSVVVVVPPPRSSEAVADAVGAAEAPTVEIIEAVASEPKPAKKQRRKKPSGTTPPRGKRRKAAKEAPVAIEAEGSTSMLAMGSSESIVDDVIPDAPVAAEPVVEGAIEVVDMTTPWTPTMPPVAATPTVASVPWRRGFHPRAAATLHRSVPSAPSLVIDDAAPDLAEREQSRREAAKDQRVSFLPPILLDREDRSQRQGGLTLAVIILLIAATLTLSYLMRRPTVSGDGVTMRETPATLA